ncbi:monooxygenase [Oleoguttula sp. CCFEE 5521]
MSPDAPRLSQRFYSPHFGMASFLRAQRPQKYLVAENTFSRIQIFEQRSTVGGIWNYVPCPDGAQDSLAPPCNSYDTDDAIGHRTERSPQRSVMDLSAVNDRLLTPLYDRLETNIPRDLMGFSDLEWAQECQLFPKHQTVLEYIEQYSQDIKHLIAHNTRVVNVRQEGSRWHIDTQPIESAHHQDVDHHVFDAVIVASGHFDDPYMPNVPGMKEWMQRYPGSILHSKYYRTPDRFANKRVIVVGNSASGTDIGAQIRTVCKAPLVASTRSISYLQAEAPSGQLDKPAISEFLVKDRTVIFTDGSQEKHVDMVLYCTGYLYSFPFLKGLDVPVVTTGERVQNLYQHLFYRPNPSLVFPTLNQKIIPFPFAEAQGAVIARVLSGRLALPASAEMKVWERQAMATTDSERDFHVLKFPKDANYINMMHDWAMRARGNDELLSDGARSVASTALPAKRISFEGIPPAVGKRPPYWSEREYWMRERFPAIKKAFQDYGEARYSKRTLAEVDFVYDG